MKTEKENIMVLLKQCYEKDAWHGPSVKDAIAPVTPKSASNRLPNTHSIIELVAHMTSWRTFTIEKLKGNTSFQVSDEMNFPIMNDWTSCVKKLEESQHALLKELEQFPDTRLAETVPGNATPVTFYTLLHGIINHDVYHSGQIVLIHKATAAQSL